MFKRHNYDLICGSKSVECCKILKGSSLIYINNKKVYDAKLAVKIGVKYIIYCGSKLLSIS